MDKSKLVAAGSMVVMALALIALVFVTAGLGGADNAPTARGVSNFDSITLSDDLVVGGTTDIAGAVTIGANDLYPLGNATDGQAVYAASATVTGTSVIAAGTHGLSTIVAVTCDINAAPGTGAGAPAFCVPIVSGTTVTVTVKQDDWTTNATSGILTSYVIIGTP